MIQPKNFPGLPSEFEYDTEVHESFDREHSIFFNIYHKKSARFKRGLLIVHGHGEHGGRYFHFPHYLQSRYDFFIAVDLRGHGRSEGTRGHVYRFDEYVDDLLLGLQVLRTKVGEGVPLDLFAHSMGALVAFRALLYKPNMSIERAILSAPLMGLSFPIPMAKEIAGRVLAKLWPSFQMATTLDASRVSHDPEVVKAYQEDRLVHSKATPAFYFGMLDSIQELKEKGIAPDPQLKLLLQIPLEDGIVDPKSSIPFFDQIKLKEKTLKTYPGLYHEIYNESNKQDIFQDWLQWM